MQIDKFEKIKEFIKSFDSFEKISFEVLPGFFDELRKIEMEYGESKQMQDKIKLNRIVDIDLKNFLRIGYNFLNELYKSTNPVIPKDKLGSLVQKKEFLESLVFNDDNWNKFSQKLKSGSNYMLPQLI